MKYYIIAGEPSGDKHGANLITEIKQKNATADFQYWGGDAMQSATNKKPVIHIRDMAFMGFLEVVKNILTIRRFFAIAKKDIKVYDPDVIIFIDYPGFNLRMSKWAKQAGYKVIYYISPTVWAWHKSRVYQIEKYVDMMICILPFEIDFYKNYHVNAKYFGNPIVDEAKAFVKDENFLQSFDISKPILALLPGSRKQEILLILPEMLKAAASFSDKYEIVIAKADHLENTLYDNLLNDGPYTSYKVIGHNYQNILAFSKIALVTSGTATLETAMFGVPQVVCYKTSPISYMIAKKLVTLKYISLVNLIAQENMVVELIQEKCTSANIISELKKISAKDKTMYDHLYTKLGSSGSANRIADAIVDYIKI
jgi:lipid-A-disaccharide synthase